MAYRLRCQAIFWINADLLSIGPLATNTNQLEWKYRNKSLYKYAFQNGQNLPLDKMTAILGDDIFKCIFLNEKVRILIKISPTFVPKCPIDDNQALVEIMAWRRKGDKPLSEPMMIWPTDAYIWR